MRSMNRRRFMKTASTGIAAGALPSFARQASAKPSGELTLRTGSGGPYGQAIIDAYVKPFEAETGIKVNAITDLTTAAQLELMVTTNSVTVDVAQMSQASLRPDLVEKIDYSLFKKQEVDGLLDFAKQPYGVASVVYSFVMVLNTNKFPAGKPRPTSWAEFWDVQKFPGVRVLANGQLGSQGPWEEALLADGVPADKLYPMDIDRIFASLDKIKPRVRKWWTTGAEVQQIMQQNAADLLNSYDGRAVLLMDQGAPLEINRNQAKLTWDFWAIPKGAPNRESAQRFVEFATRADRQAAFAQLIPYGPTNRNAFQLIPEKLARKLASHPDYMKSSILLDMNWYGQVGSDGQSNAQRLIQRWNKWILS